MSWRGVAPTLALAVTLVAGCGVPDAGPPVVDGTPQPGARGEQQGPQQPPPRPEDLTDSRQVTRLYFHAAATEWSQIPEYVGHFLVNPRDRAAPPDRIRVVRIPLNAVGEPDVRSATEQQVTVRGTVIGELAPDGVMHPASGTFTYTFTLRYNARRAAWLVVTPPPGYVLSVEAVMDRFDALPLYFINRPNPRSLVPDVRYMPRAVEMGKQRSMLVDWLLQGPSPDLAAVAENEIPNGTKRTGNVVVEGSDVVVNLSSEADLSYRKDLMLAQLVWTLRPRMNRGLRVLVDGRPVTYRGRTTHPRDAFDGVNAVAALPAESFGYYVDDRQRVAALPHQGGSGDLPQVLTNSAEGNGDYTSAVTSAGLSRSGDVAALVRSRDGRLTLWLGRARGPGDAGTPATYQKVTGLPATDEISRPTWVGGSAREMLLVAAAGRLYEVRLRDASARQLRIAGGLGPVRAVEVAPDGYRVAFVAGDRVYLAALSERRQGGVEVGSPRLVTSWISQASDVTWSRESHLAVAGRGAGKGGVWEISTDGIEIERLPSVSSGVPQHIAGYPRLDRRGRILVEQGGRLYELYATSAGRPSGTTSPPVGHYPFFAM